MSHAWDCPDPWEVRSRARRDAEDDAERRDYSEYRARRYEDCEDAEREYRRAYSSAYHAREDEIAEERAARRRAEERAEIEQWEAEQFAQAQEFYEWQDQQEHEHGPVPGGQAGEREP